MPFSSVEDAIEAIGRGEIVVVVDDEDRENEGDLIMAADAVTPEKIAFFLAHTSGLICVPLTPERVEHLDLPLMVTANTEVQRTAFTVSVDYRHGTSTGISASDRAATIKALADPHIRPTDLNRPGHIFPLRYRPGGVLKRAGHTEAAVDLARAAGMSPAGVLCEVVSEDKTGMARLPELLEFADKHGLHLISIADLIRYRRHKDKLVRRHRRRPDPHRLRGVHRVRLRVGARRGAPRGPGQGRGGRPAQHAGAGAQRVPHRGRVRLAALRLRTRSSTAAMAAIDENGSGVIVYLRGHEGRGIGLAHKLRAYNLQEEGYDTVDANLELGLPADSREYGIGAQILVDLGVTTMRLMTNNPTKYGGLEGFGLDIVERVNIQPTPTPENIEYLRTKRERMGHLLEGLDDVL